MEKSWRVRGGYSRKERPSWERRESIEYTASGFLQKEGLGFVGRNYKEQISTQYMKNFQLELSDNGARSNGSVLKVPKPKLFSRMLRVTHCPALTHTLNFYFSNTRGWELRPHQAREGIHFQKRLFFSFTFHWTSQLYIKFSWARQ